MQDVSIGWREPFDNADVNRLHAEAFDHPVHADDWIGLTREHSLGWVVARHGGDLVGFVNVLWDGMTHAWIQDVMVTKAMRGRGVGTAMVSVARDAAAAAGCEWLHVDFDDDLAPFYFAACGFSPTSAGLIDLTQWRAR